jgi:hypothetical protein
LNRQKVLLGALAVLAAIAARVYLWPADGGASSGHATVDAETGLAGGAARPRPRATAANAANAKDVQSVLPLRLADLAMTPHTFSTGRDPWRYVVPPPPPPPKPRQLSAAELRALQEAEAARQRLLAEQAAAAAAAAAVPKPPPFTWTYIGNFGPLRQRIAVFIDGQKVWNAREGEVLEGKFIVAQIGYESVDIRFVGFPQWPATRLAVKH